ncbi:MAG TPA: TMEM175 family protein [Alphaproteobacteria bacterium]|nr:TMEM175 family protein [Alphaproteobacteria bacterium]
MNHEERDERLIRRLESFSDLVIGFSLALLSLTLVVPTHVVELYRNPWWLIAYIWTFALIASIWYTHQRLFSYFFTVRPYTILLNFVLLASLGLIVYFVQVFVHVTGEPDKVWAFLAYFLMQSIAFIAMGALYAHGVRVRWGRLDGDLRYQGVRNAVRMLATGGAILIGVIAAALMHPQSMDSAATLGFVSVAGVLGSRIAVRWLKPRIAGAT